MTELNVLVWQIQSLSKDTLLPSNICDWAECLSLANKEPMYRRFSFEHRMKPTYDCKLTIYPSLASFSLQKLRSFSIFIFLVSIQLWIYALFFHQTRQGTRVSTVLFVKPGQTWMLICGGLIIVQHVCLYGFEELLSRIFPLTRCDCLSELIE